MAAAGSDPGRGIMAAEQEAEETVSQELHSASELRIVLLGGGRAGKSETGNTILDIGEFRSGSSSSAGTNECVKRTGEVSGRRVTVVDTPDLLDTDRVKIERCVSLSDPGPHALLLVIPVYSKGIKHSQGWKYLVKQYWKSLDKVQELFGERAVKNVMILFTRGDLLRGRTIEQHIEEAGEEFQQLVEKCGNRYHVLNNEDRSDRTQVTQLLDKIDNMVKGSGGCYTMKMYLEEKIRQKERELKEIKQKYEEEHSRKAEELKKEYEEGLLRKEEELNQKYKEQERKAEEMKQKLEEERLGKAEEVKQRYETQRVKAEQRKQQYEEEQRRNAQEIKQMYEEQCGKIQEQLQKYAEQLPRELQELKNKLDEEQHSKGDELKQKYEERVCREIEELPFKKEEPEQNHEEKIKEIKQRYEEKLHRKIEELKREYEQLYLRKEEELKQKHQEELLRKEQELKQQYEEEYSEKEQQLKKRYEEQCRGVEEMKQRLEEEQQRKLEEVIQNYEKQCQGVEEMKQRYKEEQHRKLEELKQNYEKQRQGVEEMKQRYKEEQQREVNKLKQKYEELRREEEMNQKYEAEQRRREEELEKEPEESKPGRRRYSKEFNPPYMSESKVENESEESKLPVRRRNSKEFNPPHMSESKVENESEESKLPVRRRNSKELINPDRQGIMAAEQEAEETVSQELHSPSELRIVLLGGRLTGKSTAGNTILGREEGRSGFSSFAVTEKCEKGTGDVSGRRVTVVDTPRLLDTARVEIERCVSLSAPGPHAFLLVIRLYPKKTIDIRNALSESLVKPDCEAFDKIQQLFGERAVRNTMILFTRGDVLTDRTIEQYIEEAGEELQQRVEKCGNRYHVLNNEDRSDRTQVTQLLDKIDNMVKGSGGCYLPNEIYQEVEERIRLKEQELNEKHKEELRRREEEVKQMKEDKVEKETSKLPVRRRNSIELPLNMSGGEGEAPLADNQAPPSPPELRMVLLGKTGAGKSAAGNTILGREEFRSEASSSAVTRECEKRKGQVAEVRIGKKRDEQIDRVGYEKSKLLKERPGELDLQLELRRERERNRVLERELKRAQEGEQEVKKERKKMSELEEELERRREREKSRVLERELKRAQEGEQELKKERERSRVLEMELKRAQEGEQELKKERKKMSELEEELERRREREKSRVLERELKRAQDGEQEVKKERKKKELDEELRRERQDTEKGKLKREKEGSKRKQTFSVSGGEGEAPLADTQAPPSPPELRMVLLGKTGAGKSAAGNTILGREEFRSEASSSAVTRECEKRKGQVAERRVAVIDTPELSERRKEREKSRVLEQELKRVEKAEQELKKEKEKRRELEEELKRERKEREKAELKRGKGNKQRTPKMIVQFEMEDQDD